MKHLPFDSKYKSDFQVVEQRQGRTRLYPHTDQLPVLLRAIHLDFYGALPARIARVDHRGNDFDKIVLRHSSLLYCNWLNAARKDELRLYSLLDRNLVAKPAIVQQIIEDHPRGRFHRFRFYAGNDFFPEIYVCGKRVVFSDHVLQRFSSRSELPIGEDLSNFLIVFFNAPIIAMPVGAGRAFVVPYLDSILAMTYKETKTEYFITSCLTINEIHSMKLELPPHTINVHYDLPFVRPTIRNWAPSNFMVDNFRRWERKAPINARERSQNPNWHHLAHFARDSKKKEGHGPGSKLRFLDNIPGPFAIEHRPGVSELEYDEMDAYQQVNPGRTDWHDVIALREKLKTMAPSRYPPSPA